MAPDVFRQTLQGRSQIFGFGNLARNPSGAREFEALTMAGMGFQKPINPHLFVQFDEEKSDGVSLS
ncbi:MAG: hypothetical protein WBM04_04065 [Candidatus Korobacteraceae bacterium]